MKLTPSELAAIQERNEELQGDIENLWSQCRGTPDASMDEDMIAHQDRTALLKHIKELEAELEKVHDCQTYVVELDDCEHEWFKKADVLKAIGERP